MRRLILDPAFFRRQRQLLSLFQGLGVMLLATFVPNLQALAEGERVSPSEKAAAPVSAPISHIKHEAQASLAGFFAAGNTSSIAGKTEGFYQLMAWKHGLRVELGGGVSGLAKDTDGDPATGFEEPLDQKLNTTAAARIRYDYFLSPLDSAYASLGSGHDSSANLWLRLRAETGYQRVLLSREKHTLSAELGAVYSVDRAPFDGDTNMDGVVNLDDEVRFENNNGSIGARLRLTYLNAISDKVAFTQAIEVLPNLWPALEAPYERLRVDSGADNMLGLGEASTFLSKTALSVTPIDRLSIAFLLDMKYDNAAIVRRNAFTNYDITSSVSLAYKLF